MPSAAMRENSSAHGNADRHRQGEIDRCRQCAQQRRHQQAAAHRRGRQIVEELGQHHRDAEANFEQKDGKKDPPAEIEVKQTSAPSSFVAVPSAHARSAPNLGSKPWRVKTPRPKRSSSAPFNPRHPIDLGAQSQFQMLTWIHAWRDFMFLKVLPFDGRYWESLCLRHVAADRYKPTIGNGILREHPERRPETAAFSLSAHALLLSADRARLTFPPASPHGASALPPPRTTWTARLMSAMPEPTTYDLPTAPLAGKTFCSCIRLGTHVAAITSSSLRRMPIAP